MSAVDSGRSREEVVALLDASERERALAMAKDAAEPEPWLPFPHQVAPPGDWYLWLMLGGRGSGKTDGCANYFDQFMRRYSGARGGIIAPTLGDAAEACIYGPSGLLAHNPTVRMATRAGGTYVKWPNGSEAKLFGAYSQSDVDRLRAGGNRHLYWGEELAAWRHLKDAVENMELGLRLGRNPHWIASTTPRTRPKLKELMNAHGTKLTRATIHDNPKLPSVTKDRLVARYAGTRLEAQELLGQYLEDVEGALWSYETIAACRIVEADVPDLVRVVVSVDPSGGDEDGNDEQGIIVAGKSASGEYYVTHDRSCKLSPDGWGKRCVQAMLDSRADRIICEGNFGGDMVLSTIKIAAAGMGVEAPTKKITASRGKAARAEPISALYEQGRVHHVGEFAELEFQMRNWTPESGWSPDRLDALVWAITELEAGHTAAPMRTYLPQGRLPTPGDRFQGY